MRIGIVGIIDLVADAPKEDAGVIAVAAHHVGHIAVDPLLEEVVGSVERWGADVPALDPLALGKFPFVGSLVHHEQAEFVAKVIEDGCLRIVGAADGIDTNLLEVLEASTPHIVGHGSTERAGIVMQTDALDLHPAAIERKALVGIELQRTQADVDLIAVDGLIAFQERGAQQVEIGIVEVPAMRTSDIEAYLVGSLGANHLLSHHVTIGIEQLDVQLQAVHTLRIVDGNIDIDLGRSIGKLGANPTCAPLGKVRLRCFNIPHIAIDARARVPTAIGITAMIDTHREDVVACLEVGRHVVEERREARGTIAEQVAVEIDRGAVVDGFEVDEGEVRGVRKVRRVRGVKRGCQSGIVGSEDEMLAVPGDATGIVARTTGEGGRSLSFDRPVVGQVEMPPFAVVETGIDCQ